MLEPADIDRIAFNAAATALQGIEVIDVHGEPSTDWYGKDALRITIIVKPGEVEVSGEAAMNTLAGIYQGLADAGEERFPYLSWATEDEMMQVDDDT